MVVQAAQIFHKCLPLNSVNYMYTVVPYNVADMNAMFLGVEADLDDVLVADCVVS